MKYQLLSLQEVIESSSDDIDKKISEIIKDKEIMQILEGGKRLRPILACISYKACTQGKELSRQYQKMLEGIVTVELAHAASLVHDDIIDKDLTRRGKPAFYVQNGVPHALLTGHKILSLGFNIALKHGSEFAKLYVDSWNKIVNGEIDEVNFNKNGADDFKESYTKSQIFRVYNRIINLKTAVLFSSACKAAALEANMPVEIQKLFADYGQEIGIAYQLADDLVDLEKNGEMIDSVVVPLLNKLDAKNLKLNYIKKIRIKKKLSRNKSKIQQFYFDEIQKHVRKAEELIKSDLIPYSTYKDILHDMPAHIINSMLKEINVSI
jgi:geranylgeranyl pyrophosphate synthase